jgi:hypothetical protein
MPTGLYVIWNIFPQLLPYMSLLATLVCNNKIYSVHLMKFLPKFDSILCGILYDLELHINLSLGMLWRKHLTNGDQWEKCQAVIQAHIFYTICIFPWTVIASDEGFYPSCTGQLPSLERKTAGRWARTLSWLQLYSDLSVFEWEFCDTRDQPCKNVQLFPS